MNKTSAHSKLKYSIAAFLLAFCLTQLGCNDTGFEVAKASGTIKKSNGEVLQNGIIAFTPLIKNEKNLTGKRGYGEITNGKFVLTTYGNEDGAVVGPHQITLTEAWRPDEEYVDADTELPKKHGCVISPETMEVEVISGQDNVFELIAVPKKKRRRNEPEDD
ncbi:MAG: hypothetical protein AB8B55_18570 [Mariniblastus sp.]